jgi:hypothetical protein
MRNPVGINDESEEIVMNDHILVKRYITHCCVENAMANLCDHFKIDFRPLFLFSWDLGFKTTAPILADNIHYYSNFDVCAEHYFEFAKLYLGLVCNAVNNDATDITNLLIDGNIVLITSNAYNLPWNSEVPRVSWPHTFTVKYDSVKKIINVTDSFYSDDIVDLENLNEFNIDQCFSVKIAQHIQNEITPVLVRDRYFDILKYNNKNEIYNSIEKFSNWLDVVDSIEKLTNDPSYSSNALLVRKLRTIANGRYNTKCLFEYLRWPDKYINAMSNIHIKWELVKNMFIKIIISKKLELISKIKKELLIIANLERNLCHEIVKEEDSL